MKMLTQYLSLLLCFELIMAPVQGSLLIGNAVAEDPTCPAGQHHDRTLGRCLTDADVVKVNNAVKICGTDRSCYRSNGESILQEKVNSGETDTSDSILSQDNNSGKNSAFASTVNVAAMAIPLVIVMRVLANKAKTRVEGKSAYKCNPNSLLLMYGATAALVAGEVIGSITHKGKLDDIEADWKKSVVPDESSSSDKKNVDGSEAQSKAFDFLAQNEDQVAATARLKRGFYFTAAGLFASGGLMAGYEQYQLIQARLLRDNPKTDPATKIQAMRKIDLLTCSTDKENIETEDKNKIASGENAEKDRSDSRKKVSDLEKAGVEKAQSDEDNAKRDITKAEDELRNIKCKADDTVCQGRLTAAKNNQQKALDGYAQAKKTNTETRESANRAIEERNNKDLNTHENQYLKCTDEEIQQGNKCVPINPGSNIPSDIQKYRNYKIRQVAANNISTAKDSEQLLELMKEFESIEFESYSKVSYLQEDEKKAITKTSIEPSVAKIISNFLFPEAHALDILEAGGKLMSAIPLLDGILSKATKGGEPLPAGLMSHQKDLVNNWISRAIGNPLTRAGINGVLGGWMAVMGRHMTSVAHTSGNRADKLKQIRAGFVSSNGLENCTDADRKDPSKPRCYCYTPDNKINMAHKQTKACDMRIATLNSARKSFTAAAPKVCMTKNMAIDKSCSCRANKTCMKAGAGMTTMGFNPSTFKMISTSSVPANDLFDGTTSGAQITESAGINAARIQDAANTLLSKIDPKGAKESKKMADNLEKSLLSTGNGMSMGSLSSSAPLPTSPKAAADALEKEIKEHKESKDPAFSGGAGFSNSTDADEAMPDFGVNGQTNSEDIEIAEVMGKEVDFGSNDITKTKDTNLFELLSNRYQRSAIKRLFEDGKPADAPSGKDISP